MTWLDVSLKGKLMMTLESAGVVKENPTVKKDREFKSKLTDDLIGDVAEKYIPYTVQSHLKEVTKQAYNIDHLFSVDFDTDTNAIVITHHWQSAAKDGIRFVYLEEQTEADLEVRSIEHFLNTMIARQYNSEFNQIVDNWLKRPIRLPHGGVLSVIASPYLTINLKPKNPER